VGSEEERGADMFDVGDQVFWAQRASYYDESNHRPKEVKDGCVISSGKKFTAVLVHDWRNGQRTQIMSNNILRRTRAEAQQDEPTN